MRATGYLLGLEQLETRELLAASFLDEAPDLLAGTFTNPADVAIGIDSGASSWTLGGPILLPNFTYYVGPSGVVAPGQAFDPSSANIVFGGTPAAAAPDLSEWSRTADPDDSMVLTGDDFLSYQGGLTRFWVFTDAGAGPGTITSLVTQSIEADNRAIVTVPISGVPASAMYLMWAESDYGVSRPVTVNQTETWWISTNLAESGQRISVYGRNLSHTGAEWNLGDSGGPPAWVWIVPSTGGVAQQVTVTAVDPYRVEFQLPANLTIGTTYKVWVHNGRGGAFGWGQAMEFTVRSSQANGTSWTGPVYTTANNAQLLQMTTNAANADDGVLLQAVLDLARTSTTGNATVVLPAGTFRITQPLQLPSNVRLVGQGMNQTTLLAVPGIAFQNLPLFYASSGPTASYNATLQDLTLHSGYNPLTPGDSEYTGGIQNLVYFFDQIDVRFTRVRFEARAGKAMQLWNCQRVTIQDSEFHSNGGVFLNECKQTSITNSTFRLTNFAGTGILNWGGEGLSITGSTSRSMSIADTSSTANWGLRLFVNGHGGRMQYLARNTTLELGMPPTTAMNLGEHILWEGSAPVLLAKASSWSATTLTFNQNASADFSTGRYYAVVIQGQGLGQTRRILGRVGAGSTTTLTLESPFDVAIDGTSLIQVLWMAEKAVVYKNNLVGIVENVTRDDYIGPAGVMLFGGTSNIIVDQNTLTDLRLPISIWGLSRTNNVLEFEPSIFNMVTGNTISGSRYGIVLYSGGGIVPGADPTLIEKATLTGNVFRDNVVTGALESAFDVYYIWSVDNLAQGQMIANFVVEHNTFTNVPVGINLAYSTRIDYRGVMAGTPIVRDALIYKNTIQHKSSPTATPDAGSKGIIVGTNQSPTLIGNSVVGFQTTYADAVPISIQATGNPGEYAITFTPRELDRKGGAFEVQADWDGNGTWDDITPGVKVVAGGRVITIVHTFTGSGTITPRFRIYPSLDVFPHEYQVTLDLGAAMPRRQLLPVSVALIAAPTANPLEYTITLAGADLFANSGPWTFGIDWNLDGDFNDADETRTGYGPVTWKRTFTTAGPTGVRYMLMDAAGRSYVSTRVITPGERNVYFVGTDREDRVFFTDAPNGTVRVDLTRLAGQEVAYSYTFQNITGTIYAYGQSGADLLHAGGVKWRSVQMMGGLDSDTLIGGAKNDVLWGGAPTLAFKDTPNAIDGGPGTDTVHSGNNDTITNAGALVAGQALPADVPSRSASINALSSLAAQSAIAPFSSAWIDGAVFLSGAFSPANNSALLADLAFASSAHSLDIPDLTSSDDGDEEDEDDPSLAATGEPSLVDDVELV